MKIKRTSNFAQLQKNLKEFSGSHQVSFADLFPDSFICDHTQYTSVQEFIDAGGIEEESDFGGSEWNEFVASQTDFANWEEMQQAAFAEHARHKLFTNLKKI